MNEAKELPELAVPEIDRCVKTFLGKGVFSAATCIASKGGRVFHRQYYGTANQPPPFKKIGFGTLFDLGDLTQPLGSGLGALYLAGRTRIDLGAPLARTLPEFRRAGLEDMTVDMLLDHTSGWPEDRGFWDDLAELDARAPSTEKKIGTPEAVVWMKDQLAKTRCEVDPGTRAKFSRLGFMALGWILEGLVGKPLDAFLSREIYQPLGLQNDLLFSRHGDHRAQQQLRRRLFAATEECEWREKLLAGEVWEPNAWACGGVAGHAGLFGTADGVWRLVHALWAAYRGSDHVFLGGTVRRFWTRSKRIRNTTYALGWDTPAVNSALCGKRYSRNSVGYATDAGSAIWIDLANDTIGVIVCNALHPTAEGKRPQLEDFWSRLFEHIAKEASTLAEAPPPKTIGSPGYTPITPGVGLPLANPLRGPSK